MPSSSADQLLNIKHVAQILDRSRASIYRDIAKGEFPAALKVGGSSRWRESDVQAYIDARAAQRGLG
jgi:predicted DNA-binding transcriptional regulator AlpA